MNYKQQKLAALYETKEHSDCTFIFAKCNEKIEAHKLLMTLCSPVFETMFYGDMGRNEILIEDIEPAIFNKFLQFIYTGGTQIDSVEEAWNLFYACQKYFLAGLQDQCLNYVKNNLKMSNLLMCYEYGMLYGQEAIAKQCIQDVITYAKGVLLVSNYQPQLSTVKVLAEEHRVELALLIVGWALTELETQDATSSLGAFLQLNDIKLRRSFISSALYNALNREQQNVVEVYNELTQDDFAFCPLSLAASDTRFKFRYRTEFKNSRRLAVRRFQEILSPRILCTCDCLLFGIAVASKSRPAQATSDHYCGGANIYIYQKDNERISNLIYKHKRNNVILKYDDVQKIIFEVPVMCKAYISHMICIEYLADEPGDSVLLTYMSPNLTNNNKAVICFEDEGDGDVIKGLCFYEV